MDFTKDIEWIENKKQHLYNNSTVQGRHGCWTCKLGGFCQTYSKVSVKFSEQSAKKTVTCHRLMFMLCTKNFELKNGHEVSHLCHNARCVNPEHLSLEPPNINKDRQICRGVVPLACRTHPPYPDCLL